MMNISYIIVSNNKRRQKTLVTISSINHQYKNFSYNYEIILVGICDKFFENIKCIFDEHNAINGYVGSLRNKGISKAEYENIVCLDDDMILNHDWLENTLDFVKDNSSWKIISNQILNVDGTRYWDRCTFRPKHELVDYDTPSNSNLYMTGGFGLFKKDIFDKVRWDENCKVRSKNPEEFLFAESVHEHGIAMDFNKNSIVWHNDERYTQEKNVVDMRNATPCKNFLNNISIVEGLQNEKLLVVVPYRDREDHLEQFIPHIKDILENQKILFKIVVVEQYDNKPFNRGLLCNIGFHLYNENYEYICIHDVDMIGEDFDYAYENTVTHLSAKSKNKNYEEWYDSYLGGVTLFPSAEFKKINGFSNKYWGWGAEDDDLKLRCDTMCVKTQRKKCSYFALPHESNCKPGSTELENNTRRLEVFKNCNEEKRKMVMKVDGLDKVANLFVTNEVLDKNEYILLKVTV